jgi:carbamoyl-phosphate synthase small subunit
VKKSILSNLVDRGCECKVFPAKTSFAEIKKYNPDGYFLSNGPGDPAVMDYGVETVSAMLADDKAIFGICLGHQMLARSQNIGTYKMHHGHRGLNQPVKNLISGKGEITSQNHGFAISEADVEKSTKVKATHINLNDNTIEGISVNGKNAFSVQYHPEASPGPHDSRYLFDQFVNNINKK